MKWLKGLLVVIICVAGVGAVSAQSGADPALLETVETAFQATLAQNSLTINSTSLTEIEGVPIEQQTTSTVRAVRTETGWNAEGSRAMSGMGINLTSEFVALDGVVYLRFTDVPDEMAATLSEEWTNASEAEGGVMGGNIDANTLLGSLVLPIDAQSVTAVSELPAADINGQPMRVFQLTLNPETVLNSDAAGLLNAGFGGFGGGQGFPEGMQPPNLPEGAQMPALPEGVQPPQGGEQQLPDPENVQITFAVYVGEDGLIHRIYSVIALSGQAGADQPAFALTITSVTDYADFNAPVEIAAPEL
jgi:hypothetical protein